MRCPFRLRNDAWNKVERKKPLGSAAVAVDGECDSLDQERQVGKFPSFFELRGRHVGEPLEKLV